jgi:hypothetical protein
MRAPNIFASTRLIQGRDDWPRANVGGHRWVPARPLSCGGFATRCKAAWLVFTGRADAVTWEGYTDA